MRVIDPTIYKKNIRQKKKRRMPFMALGLFVLFMLGSYGFLAAYVRPDYIITAVYPQQLDSKTIPISWPSSGSAAIGYIGASNDVLASYNGDLTVPSASTIKILTALMVLNRRPIDSAGADEVIGFTAGDVERTNAISAEGGVYFPVTDGMTMTYRQALEAMLISSSNNIAEKLVIWAYGSIDEYKSATQTYLRAVGLNSTYVDEPSGLSARTVTTANDLLKISMKALDVPIIRDIISTASITINGTIVSNTNILLGKEGINGLKTGYTIEAGNCLLLSKTTIIDDSEVTFVAVIMGQQNRAATFTDASSLLAVLSDNTTRATVANPGTIVADVSAPWGEATPVYAKESIGVYKWAGEERVADVRLEQVLESTVSKGSKVGSLSLAERSTDLVLGEDLPKPDLWWRLTHALDAIGQIM
jgi:D-alanyl-D-alanine carboxypeptidase (penicillin-binding protein 5/6)